MSFNTTACKVNQRRYTESIYRYEHGPNHCPSPTLYLAQMQNQPRWRGDANSDQLKHSDLGRGSCNEAQQVLVSHLHGHVCHLPVQFSCIVKHTEDTGLKGQFRRIRRDHMNELSWAALQNTHTHQKAKHSR